MVRCVLKYCVSIVCISITNVNYFFYRFGCPLFNPLNPIQMAQVIPVTSFSKLANQEVSGTTTTPLVINVARIISISTRVNTYSGTGVSDILYALPVNQSTYQITLVVTETRAALLALCNANAVAT